MERRSGRLAKALLIFAGIGYPFLLHWAVLDGHITPGRMLLVMAPVLAFGIWLVVARGKRLGGSLLAVASVALVALVHYQPDLGFALACGLPHAAANLALLWLFGRTLAPGRTSLITRLATTVHGRLSPEVAAYTRRVTFGWTLFFAAQLVVSLLLYMLAPMAVWSLFINVLNGPLVALMFLGEYAWRHLRYRDFPHATPMQAIRAFTHSHAGAPAEASGR